MVYFKPWQELTISDDYMFKRVMRCLGICKKFLEMLLGIAIKEIRYVEEEKSIESGYASKGVRLDVYIADERETVYNIEMQVRQLAGDALFRRMRYYQSMMDVDLLAKGADYDELNDSFVIFVCQFDPFGLGRHVYTFRNKCDEVSGLTLRDGTVKIFLNAKGTADDVSDDIKAFLDYVNGILTNNAFVQEVEQEIAKIKQTEQERVRYMTYELKMRDMLKEGREQSRVEMALEMLRDNESLAKIVKYTHLTEERVRSLATEQGLSVVA